MRWRRPVGRVVWPTFFVGLFVLAMDFWTWDEPVRLSLLNLPVWIYYFALLQLVLAGAIWWFGRNHRVEPRPDSQDASTSAT